MSNTELSLAAAAEYKHLTRSQIYYAYRSGKLSSSGRRNGRLLFSLTALDAWMHHPSKGGRPARGGFADFPEDGVVMADAAAMIGWPLHKLRYEIHCNRFLRPLIHKGVFYYRRRDLSSIIRFQHFSAGSELMDLMTEFRQENIPVQQWRISPCPFINGYTLKIAFISPRGLLCNADLAISWRELIACDWPLGFQEWLKTKITSLWENWEVRLASAKENPHE